jgi:hypothetical protein
MDETEKKRKFLLEIKKKNRTERKNKKMKFVGGKIHAHKKKCIF